jgi:hypothetical protein
MSEDFFDALHTIRATFKRAGLEAPQAIILASHEEGMRFLSAIRDSGMMFYKMPDAAYKTVEHPDGSMWMQAEFAGMKIHWPANRYATQAGGYVWG